MLILALETATPVGSVALVSEERSVAGSHFDIGLQHSQRLFVEIERILSAASCAVSDLSAVAVSIGPGSFTGLRIGLSAAKGLCLAGETALVTVSTLAALAARIPYARHPVCPVLDARRDEVYTALYDTSAGRPEALTPPRAIAPALLLEERAGETTIFLGDGAVRYRDLLGGSPHALYPPSHCARPEAGTVGWLALDRFRAGETADLATAEPEYFRQPDLTVGARLRPGR